MGNQFCGGTPEQLQDKKARDDLSVDINISQINKVTRHGKPSSKIGYNINDLPKEYKQGNKLSSIQDKIAKMLAHQKRHHKSLVINRIPQKQNQLPDPYYIRSLDAIYIGEWLHDNTIDDQVPGGIGRLYSSQEIVEGEIKTIVIDDTRILNIAAGYFKKDNQQNDFLSGVKSLQANQNSNVNIFNLNIVLHGQGRRFTHNSEFRGTFIQGQLQGKGYCCIKQGQHVYEYTGEFKKSKKSGKGLEKYKLTSYDGDFQDDQKNGKGTLTLMISKTYENQRLDEQAKIALQDKQKDPLDKIHIVKNFIDKRKFFQAALAKALQQFKWTSPKYGKSMTENQNFIIDHYRRTKFLQNYRGDFKNNEFDGQGTYTWFTGKVYCGQWKQGCMHGIGEFYWPNGSIYRGQYEKDLKHGLGQMIWSLYKRFRGTWAYSLRHGYGQLIEIEKDKDKKCFVRVKGALFNKNSIDHVFFEERREVNADIEALDIDQKQMIAFIKDIGDSNNIKSAKK